MPRKKSFGPKPYFWYAGYNVRVENRTGALHHHPLVFEIVSLFSGITPDDIRRAEGTLMV